MPRPPISESVIERVAIHYESLLRIRGRRPTGAQVYEELGGENQSDIGLRKVQELVSGFRRVDEQQGHGKWTFWEDQRSGADDLAFLSRLDGTCRVWFRRGIFQDEADRAVHIKGLIEPLNCAAQLFIVQLYGSRDRIAHLMGHKRSLDTGDLDDWITFWPAFLSHYLDRGATQPYERAEDSYQKLVDTGVAQPPPTWHEVLQGWKMEGFEQVPHPLWLALAPLLPGALKTYSPLTLVAQFDLSLDTWLDFNLGGDVAAQSDQIGNLLSLDEVISARLSQDAEI